MQHLGGAALTLIRNISGHAVVSRTNNGQCILWKHSTAQGSESGQTLTRHITVPADGNIHRICVLRKGRFVVFLSSNSVVLWDCRYKAARLLARCSLSMEGSPLCLIVLPRPQRAEYRIAYIATVMSTGSGIVWELELPQYLSTGSHDDETASLSEFCRFDLGTAETPKYVLPVDPAGAAPVMSGFLDVFARDVGRGNIIHKHWDGQLLDDSCGCKGSQSRVAIDVIYTYWSRRDSTGEWQYA
ncbi:hypothetical protein E4U32_006576 [Claviceps aff. humidiphila group G2b]|nr:hypothetical protein E4U32_006576 [Claviceps aff. humidiphila group G2b]